MPENCWLIHGEEPAATSDRLSSRTSASIGKVAVLEYGAGGFSVPGAVLQNFLYCR